MKGLVKVHPNVKQMAVRKTRLHGLEKSLQREREEFALPFKRSTDCDLVITEAF